MAASFAMTILLGFLAMTTSANAEFFVGPGAVGSAFLDIPINPRAAAMGQAFTAGFADTAGLEYNPAGLAGLTKREMDFTLIRHFEDTDLQSFNFAGPILSIDSEKMTLTHPRTVLGIHYRSFKAEDEARNAIGAPLGGFDVKDQALQLSVSYAVTRTVFAGLSGKYINRELQEDSSNNFAGDAGLLWKPVGKRISLGVSVLNAGPDRGFVADKDPLPTRARIGGAFTTDKFMTTLDVTQGRDDVIQPGVGFEWLPTSLVALRLGSFHQDTIEFTGGIGLHIGRDKAPAPSRPAKTKQNDDAREQKVRETLVSSTLYQIAEQLTQAYETSTTGGEKPRLAVFYFDGDSVWNNATMTSRLRHELEQINVFQVLSGPYMDTALQKKVDARAWTETQALDAAESLAADYIVLGSVAHSNNDTTVSARLIKTSNQAVLRQTTKTISRQWMDKPSQKLGSAPSPSASGVEFGLDYAIQTADELGLSHTVMVKILF